MSTYTFKDITLEHDREWRAWRRLETSTLQEGDQIKVQDSWLDVTEYAWGEETIGEIRYRRPVPLPSFMDIILGASVNGFFEYPSEDIIDQTESMTVAEGWLRELLPGYEEQLAKEHGGMNLSVSKEWCEKRFAKESDADITAGTGDSPVPADGWRPIEKPPLGVVPQWIWRDHRTRALGAAIERYQLAGRYVPDEWIQERAEHVAWLLENGKPLPPPPQEKGGEA